MSGQHSGESPSGTMIRGYTDLPIVDQFGNSWAISRSGQVMVDGAIDRTTSGVTELTYINRVIWQWVASERLWWGKTSPLAPWLPPAGTTDAPFGPMPDPRLDQIITAVGSLAAANAAAFGRVAGQFETLQAAIDALPPPSPPDPRIAALIGSVTRGFTLVHTGLSAISDQTIATQATLAAGEAAMQTRFDVLEAMQTAAAAKLDAIEVQVARAIVLLLDLFPQKPTVKITLGKPTFTTQPAPVNPGP